MIVMLAMSGRMMTEEQEKRLKEALKMTNMLREMIQEAEDKGIEKGHEEEKRDIACMLLKLGDSIEKISKATGLSVEVIE